MSDKPIVQIVVLGDVDHELMHAMQHKLAANDVVVGFDPANAPDITKFSAFDLSNGNYNLIAITDIDLPELKYEAERVRYNPGSYEAPGRSRHKKGKR